MDLVESEFVSVEEVTMRKRRSKFGICLECHQPRTGDSWCQPCNARRLAAISELLQWIDYSRLDGIQKIGAGGYGTVYKATWNAGRGSNLVAVQHRWQHESRLIVVALKTLLNSESNEELMHESKLILQSIKVHLRAFQCHGVTRNPTTKQYMMVVQYVSQVPTGELKNYLNRGFQDLRWRNRIVNLLYIASDLKVLHQVGLVHGDLNSGNLLVHGTALNGIRGTRQPSKANSPPLSNGKREVRDLQNGNVDSEIFIQFEEAELKRQEAARKFPKPPKKPTHPLAVYHSRLLSVVSISENGKKNGRAETVYFDAEPSEEPEFINQDLALKHLVPAKSLPRPATIYQRRSLPNFAASSIVSRLSARKSTSNISSKTTRMSNRMATIYFDAELAEDEELVPTRPRSKWKQPGEGDVPPLPPLPPLIVQTSNGSLDKTDSNASTVSSPQSENLPTPIECPSSPRGEDAITCKGKESDYAKQFNSESTTATQSAQKDNKEVDLIHKDDNNAEAELITKDNEDVDIIKDSKDVDLINEDVDLVSKDNKNVDLINKDNKDVDLISKDNKDAEPTATVATQMTQSAENVQSAQSTETTVRPRKSKENERPISKRSYQSRISRASSRLVSDRIARNTIVSGRMFNDKIINDKIVNNPIVNDKIVNDSPSEDSEWVKEVVLSMKTPHDEDKSAISNSSQPKTDIVKSSAVSKVSVEPPKLLDIPPGLQNQGRFEKSEHTIQIPKKRRFKFIRRIFKKLSLRLFRCGANKKDISLEEFEEW
ncbi:7766_t:CDS:2 [Ambispora leptoticha]|uniref:7766_t:CDS:1 n=1 Tax=Ambispora leptoticha TaxID=144679 RepID=A0A9N9AQ72_9GLOM|nr:7766_t:CDS:2 [Ambispora leptoticha]